MKRKLLALLLAMTMVCIPQMMASAATTEYPVDVTETISKEDRAMIDNFLLALSGAATVEGNNNVDDKIVYSGDTAYDYAKNVVLYFMLDLSSFKDMDTFEEVGLFKETTVIDGGYSENGYNVSAQQYAEAIDYIWTDGLTNVSAAESFLGGLYGVTLNDDNTYALYPCLEPVNGNVLEFCITKTTDTTFLINASVASTVDMMGGTFDISVKAEVDENSPFADMTVTDVDITCLENYEYWEEFNWGLPPVENSDMNVEGTWIQAKDGRWWYQHTDGQYMTNGWERINGKWYRFDEEGWMQTGWVQDKLNFDPYYWYYLGEDGAMVTGWLLDGNTWYYLNKDGKMATGWVLDRGTWYYLNANGDMATGWVLDKGEWYYLNANGDMATGWVLDKGEWYYLNANGDMATGWVLDRGTWYYLNTNGDMATGWILDNGTWYYLENNGAMACNETLTINGTSYSFSKSGAWYK